jgi:transcriptional regulator with XRE-family HTH domain
MINSIEGKREIVGRKPASQTAAVVSPGLQSRINRLADLLWKGNQSQMGRDLGIDQSSLSKTLAGKQQPSAALVERLANWKGVNPGWLLCGKGEPLLEGPYAPGVGLYRPLLDEIPPGPLSDFPELLTGVSYPVAGAHYTNTSFWLRVPVNAPVTYGSFGVKSRDLMLMETDPLWTRSADRLRGKLVGVVRPSAIRTKPEVVLALLNEGESQGWEEIEGVTEMFKITLYTGKDQSVPGWLVLPGSRESVEATAAEKREQVLSVEQVVAVRVNWCRPSW